MTKNAIFAMILSAVFVLIWFVFFGQTPPTQQQQVRNVSQAVQPIVKLAKKAKQGKVFVFENDKLKFVIAAKGGGLTSVQLKQQANTDLILQDMEVLPFALNLNVYFRVLKRTKDSLELIGTTKSGIRIKEKWSVARNSGLVNLEIKLTNITRKVKKIEDFAIGLGPGLNTDNDKHNKKSFKTFIWDGYKLIKKTKVGIYVSPIKWVAISNHYFVSVLINKNSFFEKVTIVQKRPPVLMYSKHLIFVPGETKEIMLSSYWGLKDYNTLKMLGLEKTIRIGKVGRFILNVLDKLYKATGNYGVAIVIFTTLLQLLLFPLTRKSYVSMHKMKALQPHIADLRAKYKDDAQRLNVEIMNLYKSKKVNPLAGCLPMLLQLPIFFALFNALRNTVDLKGRGFIFWITDLSMPDTITHIGQFPINVLPLLMGVSMFLQQKLQGASKDPTQRTMMVFMPVMFTFMFWGFPSGLVLYWFVSSIYTFIIQFLINKQKLK